MWVVKIDGTLAHDKVLKSWLTKISLLGGGRIIIVPGRWKGVDHINEMQSFWKFDNQTEHQLLIIEQAQYGLMLSALEPNLVPVVNTKPILNVLHGGGVAVWMPLYLMRDHQDDLTSPNTSSDCLAAWLAIRMKAERLILVKSKSFSPNAGIQHYIGDNLLDANFKHYMQSLTCPLNILHKSEEETFKQMLLRGDAPGQFTIK